MAQTPPLIVILNGCWPAGLDIAHSIMTDPGGANEQPLARLLDAIPRPQTSLSVVYFF